MKIEFHAMETKGVWEIVLMSSTPADRKYLLHCSGKLNLTDMLTKPLGWVTCTSTLLLEMGDFSKIHPFL
jgi:hypothetical protein